MTAETRISPDRLSDFARAVYASVGVPEQDASIMAESLIQADLWGHQSHGVLRLSWYLERLRNGVMHAVTEPKFLVDAGALAVIDGQDGVGQVLASLAMRDAVKRAKKHGIGTVSVRNSNHFGTVMYFTRMAAQEGCIAFMTSNGGPAMAPWGGYKQKMIGTNPWSIAVPAGSHDPMILDLASTGVARGKIYLAKQKHEPIPLGWALNTEGEPTSDPAEAIAGIILPMANHKGYGISVMMDVLSGVLSGSQFLDGVHGPYHPDRKSGVGHFITVYNIEAFMPLSEFNTRMETYIHKLKSAPLAKGFDEIFYPGELEAQRDRQNRQQGLLFPDDTLNDLKRIAYSTGMEERLPF
jgi:LDH2 family malate/lactate/ureidoglycolate dehydrogenase